MFFLKSCQLVEFVIAVYPSVYPLAWDTSFKGGFCFPGDLPVGRLEYEGLRDECSFWFSTVEEVGAFQGGGEGSVGSISGLAGISCRKITRKQDEMKKFLRKTMESKLGFKVYSMYFGLVSFVLFYYGACFNIQCKNMASISFPLTFGQSLVESQINL